MTGLQSPNGLKDSGTLFNVTEGLKRDGNLVHTKTHPLRRIAFFRLIKDQVDLDASLLVGRHTVICPHKGLFLSMEKEKTINMHVNVTAPKFTVSCIGAKSTLQDCIGVAWWGGECWTGNRWVAVGLLWKERPYRATEVGYLRGEEVFIDGLL